MTRIQSLLRTMIPRSASSCLLLLREAIGSAVSKKAISIVPQLSRARSAYPANRPAFGFPWTAKSQGGARMARTVFQDHSQAHDARVLFGLNQHHIHLIPILQP